MTALSFKFSAQCGTYWDFRYWAP